ncbi:MAG: sensor histidine kinase [Oscillospiraceae bacterium]
MKKGRFTYTTFYQLCFAFLLVMIPILLSSYIFYLQSSRTIREEVTQSLESKNKSFSEALQSELDRIITLQSVLTTNWDINKLSLMSDSYTTFEQSQAIENIRDKLWAVQSSSNFIESINIYIADMDMNISTVRGSTMLQAQRGIYERLDQYEKNRIILFEGNLSVLTESGYRSGPEQLPVFFVHTELSNTALSTFLREQTAYVESTSVLFSQRWGRLAGEESSTYNVLSDAVFQQNADSGIVEFKVNGSKYTAVYRQIVQGDLILAQYIANDQIFAGLTPLQWLLWLMVFVLVVIFLFFAQYTYRVIHTPLNHLVKAFRSVEGGDLSVRMQPEGSREFAYLYAVFDTMMERLYDSLEKESEQRLLAQKAEFKQLQSQIDPHFFYNSFFILHKRIRGEDTEGALMLSESIGSYFQYVTRSGRDVVALSEEWEHAGNYCRIQQIRFANRMELQFDELEPGCESIQVPRLILQPICENAVKYAVERSTSSSKLWVRSERAGDYLDIIVEDSGRYLTDDEIGALQERLSSGTNAETTALVNVHRRLQLYYGGECGMRFVRSGMGGLSVCMRILAEGESAQNVSPADS